jgi:ATP-binding cassette subfamily C exporter for protease/lipase
MKPLKISELREALRPLRPYVVSALLFTTAVALLSLAPIGYMRDVYGPVLNARSGGTLTMVTLILIGALVASCFLEWARARVMAGASVRFAEVISRRVFDASFQANLGRQPGARQALGDLLAIRNFITSPTLVALLDAPMGVLFLGLVFLVSPLMGAFSVFGALVVLGLGLLTERQVKPLMVDAQRFTHAAQNFAADGGRNAQVIEAMGMRGAVQRRWLEMQSRFLRNQALASLAQARGSAMSKFVMLAQGSLLLGIGVLFTLMGVLSPQAGALIIIAKLLGAKAIAPMMQLIHSWKQVVVARDAFDRLEEFLEKVPPREQRMRMPAPRGHLALDGVAVRAPGTKKTILMDVSFVVKPGRVLGVIGPSGSGKSSLARVILGLWAPLAGSARLDGVDVSGWNKAELGPWVGYLPQDVELFDGTLAENIARFGEVDREKVEEAARWAGLDPILAALPAGLDTDIGDDGCTLSGGQRQRVGLARAIYGEPRLVVLDEPNSNLDERGEADLLNAIRELKARACTVVVITHRKGLLSVTDQILVMADGRPRAFGPRDQVLQKLAGKNPDTVATSDTPSAQPAEAA